MNPSPASPGNVAKNKAYEVMHDYVSGSWYPSADEIIVKHKKSGTFWRAVYRVYEDSSEYDYSATWTQVTPSQRTITEYKPI